MKVEDIDEAGFKRFCDILRNGGTLMVHPDTWAEIKKLAPSAHAALSFQGLLCGNRVKPNSLVEVGTLTAIAVPKDAKEARRAAEAFAQEQEAARRALKGE